MKGGKLILVQLMEHVPSWQLQECLRRHHGDRYVKTFSCRDQFLTMAFAQLAPEGYEKPHGQVFLRKRLESLITKMKKLADDAPATLDEG